MRRSKFVAFIQTLSSGGRVLEMTSGKGKWIGTSKLDARLVPNRDDARQRREALGQGLRRIYQDVVQEEVPDELTELMRKLDHMPEPDI